MTVLDSRGIHRKKVMPFLSVLQKYLHKHKREDKIRTLGISSLKRCSVEFFYNEDFNPLPACCSFHFDLAYKT